MRGRAPQEGCCALQHYDAIMRYISQPPLLLDVHIHKPMLNARSWMDALLAFFPGLQVRGLQACVCLLGSCLGGRGCSHSPASQMTLWLTSRS